MRGRLFRKYVSLISLVVCATLLANGLLQIWFAYHEQTESLSASQKFQARAAANRIGQFIDDIQSQIGWTTQLPWRADTFEQRHFDAERLLRQVPAITEIALIDPDGLEQLRISRLSMDIVRSGADFADDPLFTEALEKRTYYGPIYFRHDTEPYMTIAVGGNRRAAGVSVAEINLKFVWDVVSQIHVGERGNALVVDKIGRLVAHPDISLVLKNLDLSGLAQVRAVRGAGSSAPQETVRIATDIEGRRVFTAYSRIPALDWLVFVELPLAEAFQPIYAALARSVALLVGGLALAVLAAFVLARRMVVPIHALQIGAARIGAGNLDERIEVATGDELEDVATEFNKMGEQLQTLYGNLERVSQLKRYFSPQLADLIVSSEENILGESHRRKISVVFCDLRGFTAFSSSAEPDVVMDVLNEYFECLGATLRRFEATIGYFAGDGLMAFFNDPAPCTGHEVKAAHMAIVMQDDVLKLIEGWQKKGLDLGFGVGIASGDATLGHIGSTEQFHYTAIGPVVNLASRLCDEAAAGQILVDESVRGAIEGIADAKWVAVRKLKGFNKPVDVFHLLPEGRPGLKSR